MSKMGKITWASLALAFMRPAEKSELPVGYCWRPTTSQPILSNTSLIMRSPVFLAQATSWFMM